MNDNNHEDESELQSVELYDEQMILQLSFTDDNKQRVMFYLIFQGSPTL